jgi:hypothetical protein
MGIDEVGRERPSGLRKVPAVVLEDVTNRRLRLALRPQDMLVVPIAEHLPALPRDRPIHGVRDANGETLNSAAQTNAVIRLHDQVEMVAEDGEVNEPEAIGFGARDQRSLHVRVEDAERWDLGQDAHGDMHGLSLAEVLAR